MDGVHSDRLARRLAGDRSLPRRRLSAAAGGALAAAAARSATATPYSVPLAAFCYRDRQCVPATPDDSPYDLVSGTDNGRRWDGAFNCCRSGGGRCWDDGDCCGYLTYNASYRSSRFDYAGP